MQCQVNTETIESNKIKLETDKTILKDKYELLEKLNKQKTTYLCPSCNNQLHFKDNKLHLIEIELDTELDINIIKKDISKLEIDIKKLGIAVSNDEHKLGRKLKIENDILDISSNYEEDLNEESLKDDLEYLEQYYKVETSKEKSKLILENKLANGEFSSSCMIFEKDLLKLENKVKILKENTEDISEYAEEEIREIISDETTKRDTVNRLQKNIEVIENDISRNTKETLDIKQKYIDKYGDIKELSYIDSLIDDNKKLLSET
jgi:hypothetical protein